MPEGPEITHTSRFLNKLVKNKYLEKIKILSGPYKNHKHARYVELRNSIKELNTFIKKPKNRIKIVEVDNHGKYMWFKIQKLVDNKVIDTCYIGNTYGLTGHWTVHPGDYIRLTFEFSQKIILNYMDKLQFGNFYVWNKKQHMQKISSLGYDLFEINKFNFLHIMENTKLKSPRKLLLRVLMDNTLIAGIGNYLRAEIIYEFHKSCKVDSFIKIGEISKKQLEHLYTIVKNTAEKFLNLYDKKSIKVDSGFKVYMRKTTPSGEKVKKKRDADGRTFWYV